MSPVLCQNRMCVCGGGETTKFLASLEKHGCESSGSLYPQGGLHPSLQIKLRLIRFPLIQSGYSSPTKNMYLKEALISLMNKLVVEKVVVKSSLGFYNRLFLVPKPNRKWRPILDLSCLNVFLNTGTFKMETPETMWVTSLDFSDTYFHIPVAQRSRKYLRFFLFNQTFQFTALPFGLATAPLEFTKVVKEVKLMAQGVSGSTST